MKQRTIPPESIFSFICLALVGIGQFSLGTFSAVAGVLGATLCVCVLPGYFLSVYLSPRQERAFLGRFILAVGFSIFLVEFACIAAFALHISLQAVALTLPFIIMLLAVTRWWSPIHPPERPDKQEIDSGFRSVALCTWVTAGFIAFAIGNMDVASQLENLLAIGIADAFQTALRPQDAFYIINVPPVYPFPGLHYAYALVTKLSNTTTIFTFEKMRFLWTATALATVFVGVRALSGSAQYAYLALLGSSMLAVVGPFGTVPGYYWGQLATTSQPNDVEMNVLAPIALCCLFVMLSEPRRQRKDWLALFLSIALVLSTIHQRELITLLVYGAAGAFVLLLAREYARSAALGLALAIALCGALAARSWVLAYGPGVGELVSEMHARLLSDLRQLNLSTAFRPYPTGVNAYDSSFLYGLNGLMLCIAGAVLVRWRENPAIRACGLAVAVFLLTSSFALLAIPIIFMTYDELLNTPVRHVIFVLYCCWWIGWGAMLGWVQDRWSRNLAILASITAAAIAAVFQKLMSHVIRSAELLVLGFALCGLFAAFLPFIQRNPKANSFPAHKPISLSGAVAALVVFCFLTATLNDALLFRFVRGTAVWNPENALEQEYHAYLRSEPGRIEGACRKKSNTVLQVSIEYVTCTPPFDVIKALYLYLPRDSVLLTDPLGDFSALGFIPVKLAAPPTFHYRNWEAAFPQIAQIIRAAVRDYGGMPFFAEGKRAEQRYEDARALGASHVLADPAARAIALHAFSSRPDLFNVVMDRAGWVLLALTR